MADRAWSQIGADLDRQIGRRFPPIAGGGRGYRLDADYGQMTDAEIVGRFSVEAARVADRFFRERGVNGVAV
jgi:hypothetical protein